MGMDLDIDLVPKLGFEEYTYHHAINTIPGSGDAYWDIHGFAASKGKLLPTDAEHPFRDEYPDYLLDKTAIDELIHDLKMARLGIRLELIQNNLIKPADKFELKYEYFIKYNSDHLPIIINALSQIDWNKVNGVIIGGSF